MLTMSAVYKTFQGEEFVVPSIESVYPLCDKIVMVNSDVSWTGETGNTVRPVVDKWRQKHDPEQKIVFIDGSFTTQDKQYALGYDWIRKNTKSQLAFLIDTDEVWDTGQLREALEDVERDNDKGAAYMTKLYVYLRTPFYRVDPVWGQATSFVWTHNEKIVGPRGVSMHPKKLLNQFFHHFTYVRDSWERVRNKILGSAQADGGESVLSLDRWKEDIWDNLPFVQNLHPFMAWRNKAWKQIRRIWLPDLPATLRNNESLRHFLPNGLMEGIECDTLFKLAQGRKRCVDIGTHRGRSAVILSLGADEVLTFDLFDDNRDAGTVWTKHWSKFWQGSDAPTFEAVCDALRWYPNIRVYRMDSAEASRKFGDIDLLLIDGNHDLLDTARDACMWFNQVNKGGLIVFHDYNPQRHPGVCGFVDQFSRLCPGISEMDLSRYTTDLSPGQSFTLKAFEKIV